MLVLYTNVASLHARSALDRTRDGGVTALQRLSSGLRIHGARDDAAGLAVAERIDARRRGTDQAARNANDGISLVQAGDQALATMGEGLQRMRELALQSMDAPLSDSDRRALDAELQQRLAEVDRTAAGTRFNGHAVLDGSFGTALFQVGPGAGDTLSLDLSASARASATGAIATATSADLRTSGGGFQFAGTWTTGAIADLDFSRPATPFTPGWTATAGAPPVNYAGAGNATTFSVDGIAVNLGANYGSNGALASAVQSQLDAAANGAYDAAFDSGGHLRVTKTAAASAATTAPVMAGVSGGFAAAFDHGTATAGTAYAPTSQAGFDVDGHAVSLVQHYADAGALVADLQSQLDHAAAGRYRVSGSQAGISIAHTGDTVLPALARFTGAGAAVFGRRQANGLALGPGELTFQVGQGPVLDVTGRFDTPDDLARAVTARVPGVVARIDAAAGTLQVSARDTLTIGGTQGAPGGAVGFSPAVNPPSGSLAQVDVRTEAHARDALLRLDAAIDQASALRGALGAGTARLAAVADQATRDAGILRAAHGRIVDADVASEAAAWTRSQVLQRAGLAMVAQANTSAQAVLVLLR